MNPSANWIRRWTVSLVQLWVLPCNVNSILICLTLAHLVRCDLLLSYVWRWSKYNHLYFIRINPRFNPIFQKTWTDFLRRKDFADSILRQYTDLFLFLLVYFYIGLRDCLPPWSPNTLQVHYHFGISSLLYFDRLPLSILTHRPAHNISRTHAHTLFIPTLLSDMTWLDTALT